MKFNLCQLLRDHCWVGHASNFSIPLLLSLLLLLLLLLILQKHYHLTQFVHVAVFWSYTFLLVSHFVIGGCGDLTANSQLRREGAADAAHLQARPVDHRQVRKASGARWREGWRVWICLRHAKRGVRRRYSPGVIKRVPTNWVHGAAGQACQGLGMLG